VIKQWIKVNKWYDELKEPKRFIVFMIPASTIMLATSTSLYILEDMKLYGVTTLILFIYLFQRIAYVTYRDWDRT